MKPKKCCSKVMTLKSVGTRFSSWDLFFQCDKCGKVIVENKRDHFKYEFNEDLK